MKLYCFYFTVPIEGVAAKECKMYFGDEDDIQEIARKFWVVDDSFLYYEEFTMTQEQSC